MAIIIRGLSVSKGIAIGKCYVLNRGQIRIEEEIILQKLVSKEALRFDKAIKKTIKRLTLHRGSNNQVGNIIRLRRHIFSSCLFETIFPK